MNSLSSYFYLRLFNGFLCRMFINNNQFSIKALFSFFICIGSLFSSDLEKGNASSFSALVNHANSLWEKELINRAYEEQICRDTFISQFKFPKQKRTTNFFSDSSAKTDCVKKNPRKLNNVEKVQFNETYDLKIPAPATLKIKNHKKEKKDNIKIKNILASKLIHAAPVLPSKRTSKAPIPFSVATEMLYLQKANKR